MRLQGAIFDMDGVLLDSMPVWQTLSAELVRSLGGRPEEGLSDVLRPMTLLESTAYCKNRYGLSQSPEELAALVNARVSRFYREEVRPKPGADAFLSLLQMQGVWMYVATATDREPAEAGLRRAGLSGHFRGLLTCSEVGQGKESPLIYEKALTRLRCRKEDCVVFEDSLFAVKTAKAAGFRVAAVYDAVSKADQPALRALADYYIPSYESFLQRVTP